MACHVKKKKKTKKLEKLSRNAVHLIYANICGLKCQVVSPHQESLLGSQVQG